MMDENEIPQPAANTPTPPLSSSKKTNYTGKYTLISIIVVVVIAVVYFSFSFMRSSKTKMDSADVGQLKTNLSNSQTAAGGVATPEYSRKINEKNTDEARSALENGKSNFPTPVNGGEINDKALVITEEQKKALLERAADNQKTGQPDQQQAQQRLQQRMQSQYEAILKQLGDISTRMELPPQKVTSYLATDKTNEAKPSSSTNNAVNAPQTNDTGGNTTEGKNVASSASTPSTSRKLDIPPGTLIYAVNDLRLSSEGANQEARATVLSGQYRNWVAIGRFESKDETMVIKYSKLISSTGEVFEINGYAVPPDTDTSVIGDVDHHYIERWGGLIAASFLQGFGQATQLSGVSGYGGIGMGQITGAAGTAGGLVTPAYLSAFPQYTLSQKAAIAAGVAGKQAGQVLQQNFNRKNTITLEAGEGVGIFII